MLDYKDFQKGDKVAIMTINREMESLRAQLDTTAKIISNKDEMLSIQAKSLRLQELRFKDLGERVSSLHATLTVKEKEIYDLRNAMKGPQKSVERNIYIPRKPLCTMNHKQTIEVLRLDLVVAENTYSECYEKTIKQEHTIDILRQAYLDFRLKEFEYLTEIDLLETSLKDANRQIDECRSALGQLDNLKEEIQNYLEICDTKCDRCKTSSVYIDQAADDLEDMKCQLKFLSDLITVGKDVGDEHIDDEKLVNMKCKIQNLQVANQTLIRKMDDLNRTLSENETEVKTLRKILKVDTAEIEELRRERDENKGALALMQKHSRDLRTEMTVSHEQLRATTRETVHSKKACLALRKKLKKNTSFVKAQRRQTILLKSRCKKYDVRVKELTSDYNQALRCVHGLRVETAHLASQVFHWQTLAGEAEEKNNGLLMEIEMLRNSMKSFTSISTKDDSIPWSDLEYLEAIESGTKMCSESKKLTKGVREWMDRMKVERELMSSTIKSLKRKNRQLLSRLYATDYGLPLSRSGSSDGSLMDPGDRPFPGSATRLQRTTSGVHGQPMPFYTGFCQLMAPILNSQPYWDENPYILPSTTPQYPTRAISKPYVWGQYSSDP